VREFEYCGDFSDVSRRDRRDAGCWCDVAVHRHRDAVERHNADVTSQASWSSSNTAAATVSGTGVVTAIGSGTSVITASYSSVVGSDSITVP
jgi:hypothetical protein